MHTLTKIICWAGQQKKPYREAGSGRCYKMLFLLPPVSTVLSCRHLSGVASEWFDFEKLRLSKIKFIFSSCFSPCHKRVVQWRDHAIDIRIIDWLKHARIPARIPARATNVARTIFTVAGCTVRYAWPYLKTSSYR